MEFPIARDIVRIFESVGEWFHHVYPGREISIDVSINEDRELIEFLVQIEYMKGQFKTSGTYITFDQANGKDMSYTRRLKETLFDRLTYSIRESMVFSNQPL